MSKAKIRLTLDVVYELKGTAVEDMEFNMEHIVKRAFEEALLTNGTEAEVEHHSHLIEEIPIDHE